MPQLCIERGYWLTRSYMETEADSHIIRRAKGFAKVMENMTVVIDEGELVVGRTTSKYRGGMLVPEIQWEWYIKEIEALSTRDWNRMAPIPDEEKKQMREFLPYWKGLCTYDKWQAAMPREVLGRFNNVFLGNTSSLAGIHLGHVIVDYEKVLKKGLIAIKEEVAEKLKGVDLIDVEDFHKYQFYKSVNTTIDAVMNFAARYAQLAREMAEKEAFPARKAELLRIAEVCTRVPAYPARDYYEAIQSIWFILIAVRIEGWGPGLGFGRLDQYLYPLYQADIEAGTLTRDQAVELLQLLMIKMNDTIVIGTSTMVESASGFMTMSNIVLGGVTPDGQDAVNELSYVFLDAEKDVALTIEEIVIRVSNKNPDAFLIKAIEVAKALKGKLKFISDDTAIQQLLNQGKPIDRARNYVLVGCFTPTVPSYSYDTTATMINLAALFELALNGGKSRLTGEQWGVATPDPATFTSFDDVMNALKKQMDEVLPIWIMARNVDRELFAQMVPLPFTSGLFDECLDTGKDILNGGLTLNTESHGLLGVPDVGDSLAALKKVVYDDRKFTLPEVLGALDSDFKGCDHVLRWLKAAPKFGNDDDYVDSILNEVIRYASGVICGSKGYGKVRPVLSIGTVTLHLTGGRVLAAFPDGRKAGEPLSEGGISPHQGRNVSGPTSTLRSVAKLDHVAVSGGSVLNIKLNPDTLSNIDKIKKFSTLLRGYAESGGYHVQFNIISNADLRDAQKNPEKYRDLLVRVATYSAYFVELSPRLQDDIIDRMEFNDF